MKKLIGLLLVLLLCLSIAGCGKSEAVKNVEAMIEGLGEITVESIDAIRAAEEAYGALTPEEQGKVKNIETLSTARDRYYELVLVGEWCYSNVYLYELDSAYDRVDLILNADMTGTDMIGTVQKFDAQWSVTDGRLTLKGDGISNIYDVAEKDGNIVLMVPDINIEYIRQEDYHALLDDAFMTVNLAEAELSEYFDIEIFEHEITDEWGDPTGQIYVHVILRNSLYDQGWLYLSSSDDLAIEILYPAYTRYFEYQDGSSWTDPMEEGSYTYAWCPYAFDEGMRLFAYNEDSRATHDLTEDEISFGRARGTVVFINSKYVSEVRPSEDGYSRVLITDFTGNEEYYSGSWYSDLNY